MNTIIILDAFLIFVILGVHVQLMLDGPLFLDLGYPSDDIIPPPPEKVNSIFFTPHTCPDRQRLRRYLITLFLISIYLLLSHIDGFMLALPRWVMVPLTYFFSVLWIWRSIGDYQTFGFVYNYPAGPIFGKRDIRLYAPLCFIIGVLMMYSNLLA